MQYTVVPQPGTEQKVSLDESCDLDLANPKTKLDDDELKIWKNKKRVTFPELLEKVKVVPSHFLIFLKCSETMKKLL